jgi:hypothetical protein
MLSILIIKQILMNNTTIPDKRIMDKSINIWRGRGMGKGGTII